MSRKHNKLLASVSFQPMTAGEIVSAYIRDYRRATQAEMLRFARLGLRDAIRNAALCSLPNGYRQPHQRRLSKAVLEESERRLQR